MPDSDEEISLADAVDDKDEELSLADAVKDDEDESKGDQDG